MRLPLNDVENWEEEQFSGKDQESRVEHDKCEIYIGYLCGDTAELTDM